MITFQANTSESTPLRLGLDIGSTTVKGVVLDDVNRKVLWSRYARHYSDVFQTLYTLVSEVLEKFADRPFTVTVTGSAGIGASQRLDVPFVQEVIAGAESVSTFIPHTDVVIELGGEDAKITFFEGSIDQRMNETCAGGTGAFIDQIAVTLKTDPAGIDELASKCETIYPIAARCGVFTKSDVTMLLNEGARKEDIAASVLQAVVDQVIGGLACGRKIRGNVAFLGGPLHFLPQLRRRFVMTLGLTPEQEIKPEDGHFYVALGAALLSKDKPFMQAAELWQRVNTAMQQQHCGETDRLPPLFADQEEYKNFENRHAEIQAEYADVTAVEGDLFFGVDAGSTTTKAVLMDGRCRIVRCWYGPNEGEPIRTVLDIIADIYRNIPDGARIKNSCVTGYGEKMLQAALGIDEGEVETLAHYRAASRFVPDVSFILDIGGQDIKCIYIKDGRLDRIVLNEACSSGCGSFLETFAGSLGYDITSFATEALFAQRPIDLGTRCTVFMNSKVKQAQKENAPVSDISAGLAYSVAKNALYKVLKIADVSELGDRVMVQGGTFKNPSVLRAFESLIGRDVFRADISGVMGAFGAALIARERSVSGKASTLLDEDSVRNFSMESTQRRCGGCSNRCMLGIHKFSGGKRFVSGNKCEKGFGKAVGATKKTVPNLFAQQLDRLFGPYKPRDPQNAPLGEIGIPRTLNMYENYPFWFTLFDRLGFRVVLSDPSTVPLYNKGIDSISSQTLCFPAKLANGHVVNLVEKGVRRIFYPGLPMERREFADTVYTFNCPVVASYPEVIRLNIDSVIENQVELIEPFLPGDDPVKLGKLLYQEFKQFGVSRGKLREAIAEAEAEQKRYKNDVRQMGEAAVREIIESGVPAIVLAGRPYHLDPLVHHGIPDLIVSSGAAVLSGDSVAHLGSELLFPLLVVDQWGYHARLYRAATFAAKMPNFQMIQMTSFGCGLDAVTAEQVSEILASVGKVHTLLKIDEGAQLGAVKIRVRSLLSTMVQTESKTPHGELQPAVAVCDE